MDLDTTVIKPLRSRPRERRRSSMGPSGVPAVKRVRGSNMSAELPERKTLEKEVETIVKASVMTPETGGHIHMVLGITQDTPDNPVSAGGDQTSQWSPCEEAEPEAQAEQRPAALQRSERIAKHLFLSKTVIRPETCSLCGKRIRFGKMAVKCRKCRIVAHPECQQKLPSSCTAQMVSQDSLEGCAPLTHPRIPQLIRDCVSEIERRGLQERGIYRVPGGERLVKDLRDRFVQGKPLMLSRVQDVHVLCGLLKDFLRRLKEPLITFRMHQTFMEVSELTDEESSVVLSQVVSKLPKVNRDTLAFIMLHLHRVMRSPHCQMDQNNLSRVFGPTIVGHGMSEPSPTTIMRDTSNQPKVMFQLLSLPEELWRRFLTVNSDQVSSAAVKICGQDEGHGRLFQPLTSPELNSYYKTPGRGSLRGRIRNLGTTFTNTGGVEPGRRFFTSPS
uniref:Si:ch1073-416j23.1 n=2 Tax=Echeneis naucrates TaxID=173247 RepID=A0A665VCK9_ECHNA